MPEISFWIYLAVTAGITYLVRAVPLILVKGRIKNRFILSFLHYIPYAVLTAMTIPAIFYAVDTPIAAAVGFCTALILAFFGQGLTLVALAACSAVYVTGLILH